MRTAPLLLLVVSADVVHVDGDTSIRVTSELMTERDGPWLQLDPQLPIKLESFDAERDGKSTTLELGTRAKLTLDGEWWSSGPRMLGGGRIADRDVRGNGWSAGVRGSYDLGPVVLEVGISGSSIDTPYGSGRYRDYTVALTRRFHWTRNIPGWISLSVGRRVWHKDKPPPPGEEDSTTLMLSVGGSF